MDDVAEFPTRTLREGPDHRLDHVQDAPRTGNALSKEARRYVEAILGLEVYSHHVYPTHRGANDHEAAHDNHS
jgi:hypothetical protein